MRRSRIARIALGLALTLTCGLAGCTLPRDTSTSVPDTQQLSSAQTTDTELRQPRLAGTRSWAMPIGADLDSETIDRLADVDLVIVDGEQTTVGQVASLKARGAVVLGYLSIGTIEPWRDWYPAVEQYRLEKWPDWDEYYADTSAQGYRDAIMMEVTPTILEKGFDGLFLDNVDMIQDHPAQAAGMERLVEGLSMLVDQSDGILAMQNGEGIIGPMLPYIDVWNREDVTFTYDFEAERSVRTPAEDHNAALTSLDRMRRLGILTLALDYPPPDDTGASAEAAESAGSVGALSWTADIALTRTD